VKPPRYSSTPQASAGVFFSTQLSAVGFQLSASDWVASSWFLKAANSKIIFRENDSGCAVKLTADLLNADC
jgi:hypothetical protein